MRIGWLRALLDEAYALLDKSAANVVLGPSADGGYYLVGMNRMIATIFDGIGWSDDNVLAQTTQKIDDLGLKLKLLPHRMISIRHTILSAWSRSETAVTF